MREEIGELLERALEAVWTDLELPPDVSRPTVVVERARGAEHGDFASPLALAMARTARRKPRELAERLIAHLPPSPRIERVEAAGPGFINFHLAARALYDCVRGILDLGERYGRSTQGGGRRVQVEFVSANPTGPLHVGHGRGAAYGASLANLLELAGWRVHREYYVNDAGRQMAILALSVWLRYLEARGEPVAFPANGYRGDYIRDIAARLAAEAGEELRVPAAALFEAIPADEPAGGDKEAHVDALVARARALLGEPRWSRVDDLARDTLVEEIRSDLAEFGVRFDRWYSERSLATSGAVDRAVGALEAAGHLYRQDGALWFRASAFGDEKDRVVIREDGRPTYFASDIGYHAEKYERGFERVIDILGADHHGYEARLKGVLQALGLDPARFDVLLVQFANLYRGSERVAMSTRSGSFVTLRELREEVGNDAARFFYVMRKCEQHLDFDLELAKRHSNDNPVYYVQYAHARICSVLGQLEARGLDAPVAGADLARLTEEAELALMRTLARWPEVVSGAAAACEPHQVAFYAREVATDLHAYYNAHTFLVEDAALRAARVALITATRQVLRNALGLLGVGAPESM